MRLPLEPSLGKAPLLTPDIRRIAKNCPKNLTGVRDRALVLIGYAGAFRRSELAAIEVADLTFSKNGLVIDLRRSKTDQEASGRKVGIPFGANKSTCPVRCLRHFLTKAKITSASVFRGIDRHGHLSSQKLHRDSVRWILKVAAHRSGRKTEPLGGHSLRAGFATQAAMNGENERDIMRQTGDKSSVMLARYIRIGQMFMHNAAAGLGI